MTTDTPNFFPSPTTASLQILADRLADFANTATEALCYEDHTELLLVEAKLRSYADLLRASDHETFLTCEVQAAEQLLTAIRDHHAATSSGSTDVNPLTTTCDSSHDSTSTTQPKGD
jgi:hypothetical protein